jgi:CHAT domain-containing protein
MDFFISSYTPTLDALVQATDRRVPIKRKETKILLASVQQPFQGEHLLSSDEEAQRVVDLSPIGSVIQCKGGDDGGIGTTSEASDVLRLLPDATIMHLASHGVQDARDPLKSGFIMQDRLLTVQDLMNLPLHSAFLAFLSACDTAKGDAGQPDQAVHLSATMLYAGFTSVIGTMWYVLHFIESKIC